MTEAIDYDELSTKFECVKLGMRHTKDGHVISFAINPHDSPQDLMTDPLGQRYLIVAVRLNQEDVPVAAQQTEDGKKAIKLAGTLCSDETFQEWLTLKGYSDDMSEEAATVWLRKELDIKSRKELMFNGLARQKLVGLRDLFMNDIRNGVLYRKRRE